MKTHRTTSPTDATMLKDIVTNLFPSDIGYGQEFSLIDHLWKEENVPLISSEELKDVIARVKTTSIPR